MSDNGASADGVVVQAGGQPAGFTHNKRRLVSLAGIVLVIAIIAIGFGIYYHSHNSPANVQQRLVSQAIPLLDASKVGQLANVLPTIQKQPNYKNNINYVYIILTYDINTSNSSTSQGEYAHYLALTAQHQTLTKTLAAHAYDTGILGNQVQAIARATNGNGQNGGNVQIVPTGLVAP